MQINVTKEQARKFLLTKQLLMQEPKSGYRGVKEVFEKLRVVQYDPLNPCGRNPDLVLQARVRGYHPEGYFKWLYEDRRGIECYDKALCIVPIEDYVYTSHNRIETLEHPEVKEQTRKYKKDLRELLNFIDKKGPISTGDVEEKPGRHGTGWYGYGHKWGKFALELLWKTGQIVIVKRLGANKFYDLPHKVYSKKYLLENKRHIEREHILRRVGSASMMRAYGMTDAWRGIGSASAKNKIVSSLLQSNELTEVCIAGVKTKYLIRTKDKYIIDRKAEYRDEMIFIAPLDTLMWDRNMIHEIFDFFYRWEVYVPEKKRQWGYYVLPILYKDRFVGRLEPVFQKGELVIKNIWKEKGINWDRNMAKKLSDAIDMFGQYLNAERVVVLNK